MNLWMMKHMDLYTQMGEELRAVFKDLFDSERRAIAKERMAEVLDTAAKIGGPIEMEAELLYMDVLRYIDNPDDEKCIEIMKEHAMRLEQETREL